MFFKIKYIVIGLLTIFFFISPGNQAVAEENPAGKIIRVEGTVEIIREGKVLGGLLNSEVYQTDEIKTGPNSLVELLFRDRSSIHLGPDSSLKLTQYKFSLKDDNPSFIAKMTKGIFVYISGAMSKVHPGSVKFETPDGLIGIRGTKIAVSITTGSDSNTIVINFTDPDGHVGKVKFTNPSGSTTLDKEFFAIIAMLGKAPPPQIFMEKADLEKIIPSILWPIIFGDNPSPYTPEQVEHLLELIPKLYPELITPPESSSAPNEPNPSLSEL